MGERRNRSSIVFASTVAVGVLLLGSVFLAVGQSGSKATISGESSTLALGAPIMTVNGSSYFADNVTGDMIPEIPGTFHFANSSVTFLGVEFQTICTNSYGGCPPPATPGLITTGPGITLLVTFPDLSSEMVVGGFPMEQTFFAFSHHQDPQAGILIDSPDSGYKSYLLVSTTSTTSTSTMTVNGSVYYADNVTPLVSTDDYGNTLYFSNGSVVFDGVEFRPICTSVGCPGIPPPTSVTTIAIPSEEGFSVNVTFSDHTSEVVSSSALPDPLRFGSFTQHTNPQAGILMSDGDWYLLVSYSA